MTALILCGFYCAGKTTLGKAVAQQLAIPHLDTDFLIEQAAGQSRKALWGGGFRDLETAAIKQLKPGFYVLSVGGGALMREENRILLKNLGEAFYLNPSWKTLKGRIEIRGFPSYADNWEELERIWRSRQTIYEGHCLHHLLCDRYTEKEQIDTISEQYGQYLRTHFSDHDVG